ncbi:hypothetical protein C8R47DRAFT_512177 [Mycena vitilis]|nr:hypothetical protein C8R47DRAFT_512177 [Mycena vitilis]
MRGNNRHCRCVFGPAQTREHWCSGDGLIRLSSGHHDGTAGSGRQDETRLRLPTLESYVCGRLPQRGDGLLEAFPVVQPFQSLRASYRGTQSRDELVVLLRQNSPLLRRDCGKRNSFSLLALPSLPLDPLLQSCFPSFSKALLPGAREILLPIIEADTHSFLPQSPQAVLQQIPSFLPCRPRHSLQQIRSIFGSCGGVDIDECGGQQQSSSGYETTAATGDSKNGGKTTGATDATRFFFFFSYGSAGPTISSKSTVVWS